MRSAFVFCLLLADSDSAGAQVSLVLLPVPGVPSLLSAALLDAAKGLTGLDDSLALARALFSGSPGPADACSALALDVQEKAC